MVKEAITLVEGWGGGGGGGGVAGLGRLGLVLNGRLIRECVLKLVLQLKPVLGSSDLERRLSGWIGRGVLVGRLLH